MCIYIYIYHAISFYMKLAMNTNELIVIQVGRGDTNDFFGDAKGDHLRGFAILVGEMEGPGIQVLIQKAEALSLEVTEHEWMSMEMLSLCQHHGTLKWSKPKKKSHH